jgi:CubicO group peptidase (beta-lactamase class C family)
LPAGLFDAGVELYPERSNVQSQSTFTLIRVPKEELAVIRIDEHVKRSIDQVFSYWDRPGSPGAALAVTIDGELAYAKGYGMANLEYGLPIIKETIFHVASVSKQFTAMAVMLLVEEGRLSLDEDIHTYLPELPDFGHKITLAHLLHHTSGLRDQWELLVTAGWRMDDVITREQILKLVHRQRQLNFQPGAEYLYSNTGFTLAAEIVHRVSGQTLREFCAQRIFTPLGMMNTHFHDDHQEIVPNRAYSYAPQGEEGWRKAVLSYATVGATSLFTTVVDLAKWLHNFATHTVGSAATFQRMQTEFTLLDGTPSDYGLGLMLNHYHGLREVGHSGADAGFRAWCGRFPERGLGIVILSNFACAIPRDLAHQVAEILLPELRQEVAPSELPRAEDYQGEYFLLTDGTPISLQLRGEELRFHWAGRGEGLLQAVAADTWDCPELGMRIVGTNPGNGRIERLALQSPRMNLGARRLPAYQISVEQLAAYEGEYYAEELAVTYHLQVRSDKLVATSLRHSDLPLIPSGPDAFIGGQARVGDIQFQRDESGRITGMYWSGNRVRNLWFERRN